MKLILILMIQKLQDLIGINYDVLIKDLLKRKKYIYDTIINMILFDFNYSLNLYYIDNY